MFNYINPGLAIISAILLLLVSLNYIFIISSNARYQKNEKLSLYCKLIFIAAILLPIIFSYRTYRVIEENKILFANGATLVCKGKIVSIKNGWRVVDSDKFRNTDTVVNMKSCKELSAEDRR